MNVNHQYCDDGDDDDDDGDDDGDDDYDDVGRVSLNRILNTWLCDLDGAWTMSFPLYIYNACGRGWTNHRACSRTSDGRK